jgi:hypothetical protein
LKKKRRKKRKKAKKGTPSQHLSALETLTKYQPGRRPDATKAQKTNRTLVDGKHG